MKPSPKSLIFFALATTLCGPIGFSQVAQSTQPVRSSASPQPGESEFVLILSPVDGIVKAGSPVKVKIVTTNRSARDIVFTREVYADPAINYRFDVYDESGNVPPDTELHRRSRLSYDNSPNAAQRTGGGSLYFQRLKPGESRSEVCDVGVWYDLSQPGSYKVQARDIAEGGQTWVKSNSIQVAVAAAGTSQSVLSAAGSPTSQPPFSLTLWISPHVTVLKPSEVYVEAITKNISDHKISLRTERLSTEQAGSVPTIAID